MRSAIAALVLAATTGLAFAQTQRTPPSAYPTLPTMPSAFATAPLSPCSYGRRDFAFFDRPHGVRRYEWSYYNPTSPCYNGTPYPYYSAFEPLGSPRPTRRASLPGSASLNAEEAKLRIETKGYVDVSRLEKDKRGIWRGKARMNDGRSVDVILDLEGNVYSELTSLCVRIGHGPIMCDSRPRER